MKTFLALITIVATLMFAGKQPTNATKKIVLIFIVGFMIFSAIAQIPDVNDTTKYDKSYYAQSSYYSSPSYRSRAMSKEEANNLRGSGYGNTRPGSAAEQMKLEAAQIKCKLCGYHSDNGINSLCDFCQRKSCK